MKLFPAQCPIKNTHGVIAGAVGCSGIWDLFVIPQNLGNKATGGSKCEERIKDVPTPLVSVYLKSTSKDALKLMHDIHILISDKRPDNYDF